MQKPNQSEILKESKQNTLQDSSKEPSCLSASSGTGVVKNRKRTFKEQKEFESLENEIIAGETRKAELEGLLSGGETDYSKLKDLGTEYETIGTALEIQYKRWEELGNLEDY